jgi:hypothetical protein
MSIGGASHFRREKPHRLNAEMQKTPPLRELAGKFQGSMKTSWGRKLKDPIMKK